MGVLVTSIEAFAKLIGAPQQLTFVADRASKLLVFLLLKFLYMVAIRKISTANKQTKAPFLYRQW
ncbi:hypothetical protein GCM10009092_41350 [Bowmanella denitrificans]|uniref:Uncharacterized protein n=1 Tax=Bowmanella denitrificans TaxID=366582 RepID=A0ABP3HKW6_9ALTE